MVFIYQIRNTILSRLRYRENVVWGFIGGIFIVMPQIYLWKALYGDNETVAGTTLSQLLTYVVLNRLLSRGMSLSTGRTFEDRMKNGDICLDLLRPSDPRYLLSAQAYGDSIINTLLEGLPVFLFSILFVGGILPAVSVPHALLFLLSVILAILLTVFYQMLTSLVSFWFLSVWLLDWGLGVFQGLFSGAYVPLWFMPDWIKSVAAWLPFQAMRYVPVQIYLGKYTVDESFRAILVQLLWILLFYVLQCVLWKKGIKRVVVMGG